MAAGSHPPDACGLVQAQNKAAAEQAVAIFRDQVGRTLLANEGYECQESSEGAFMLAFAHPMQALTFCLMVRTQHCCSCMSCSACAEVVGAGHPVAGLHAIPWHRVKSFAAPSVVCQLKS